MFSPQCRRLVAGDSTEHRASAERLLGFHAVSEMNCIDESLLGSVWLPANTNLRLGGHCSFRESVHSIAPAEHDSIAFAPKRKPRMPAATHEHMHACAAAQSDQCDLELPHPCSVTCSAAPSSLSRRPRRASPAEVLFCGTHCNAAVVGLFGLIRGPTALPTSTKFGTLPCVQALDVGWVRQLSCRISV